MRKNIEVMEVGELIEVLKSCAVGLDVKFRSEVYFSEEVSFEKDVLFTYDAPIVSVELEDDYVLLKTVSIEEAGANLEKSGKPNMPLIKKLGEALYEAKNGNLKSFFGIGITKDGKYWLARAVDDKE